VENSICNGTNGFSTAASLIFLAINFQREFGEFLDRSLFHIFKNFYPL
jgi:hypothetical protein